MTQPSDFQNEPTPPQQQNSGVKILLIIGGIGCGCLGLVFILMIGAAIMLPSFLNQANKAREAEGKQYVRSWTRGEEAYFLDKQTFTDSWEELGLNPPPEVNYTYEIELQPDNSVKLSATPLEPTLRSYTGAVFVIKTDDNLTDTVSGICESESATSVPPEMPVLVNNSAVECPPGSILIE
ncbi:MAG: type IV pilin-like G/H family protein [Oscillatoria sp. PMC 1051.18]|nr:type IV pilin-like G/H family protein [Oscillatoria sp. PMC 1050.18]MEC5031800.1 type IV pilin-like G/H family protein [Oscillatoria sp. PMC 1051.18]